MHKNGVFVKESTAKISYIYMTDSPNEPDSNEPSIPTAALFVDEYNGEVTVHMEVGLIGLVDGCHYSLISNQFFGNEYVGFSEDKGKTYRFISRFSNTGEYAAQFSLTERFRAVSHGYYRIEALLYEHPSEEPPRELENLVHKIDFYVAVASEWSE